MSCFLTDRTNGSYLANSAAQSTVRFGRMRKSKKDGRFNVAIAAKTATASQIKNPLTT
jgi:hypothetical protein